MTTTSGRAVSDAVPCDRDNDGTPDALDAFPDDSPWCDYKVRPGRTSANSSRVQHQPRGRPLPIALCRSYAVPQAVARTRECSASAATAGRPASSLRPRSCGAGTTHLEPNAADSVGGETPADGGPGVSEHVSEERHAQCVCGVEGHRSSPGTRMSCGQRGYALMAGAATEESEAAAAAGRRRRLKRTPGRVPAVHAGAEDSAQPL